MAERTGNSGTQFLLYALFAETFGTCVHHDNEACQFSFLQGNINFQIPSF